MNTDIIFHGSNRHRGEQIICNQRMDLSVGDSHWLGDGSYFFVEDFHSYKWIVDMFRKKHKIPFNFENLDEFYLILKGNIEVNKERIFDLTKTEYKVLFDRVYKEIEERIGEKQIAEGVIINYMFNELPNYSSEFDLVRALFILNTNKYRNARTRIGYMPQEQLCIKNLEIVKNITEYNYKDRIDTFDLILADYYFELNDKKNKSYSTEKRSMYYYKNKKKRSS